MHRASAHGMMCTPRQRGAYQSSDKCGTSLPEPTDPVTDYCPHCLNGGAVSTVVNNLPSGGWKVYEPTKDYATFANRAGLCGDPTQGTDHMIGGTFLPASYPHVPVVEHWKTGGLVDFEVEIDTNHNGYLDFFLCDLDSCQSNDIAENCFRDGHCHKLMRVPHPECQKPTDATHFECGPIDSVYPGRWYLPCRKTGHVGVHLVGGPSGTMRYRLPDNVSCKHCVLQWYWATANSCAPRGFLDYMHRYNNPFGTSCPSDGGGMGGFREGMAECGNDSVPEEFWSCADVQVSADGKSVGAVQNVGGGTGQSPNPDDNQSDSQQDDTQQDTNSDGSQPDAQQPTPNETITVPDPTAPAPTAPIPTAPKPSTPSNTDSTGNTNCVMEGDVCNGSMPCCDNLQVCIFRGEQEIARCIFWWELLEDLDHSN